jgi:hypothetical protein
MEVQIRDAIESNAEAISPLLLQLMREPSTAEQIRARLRRLGQTGVDRVLVAVAEGRVVGLAGSYRRALLLRKRRLRAHVEALLDAA